METLFGDMLAGCEQPPSANNAIVEKREQLEFEMSHYRKDSCSVNDNPIVWWRNNARKYPLLAECAKSYLMVNATSVPSERMFSAAGSLISAKRACLDSSNVDMILFLNKNLPMF